MKWLSCSLIIAGAWEIRMDKGHILYFSVQKSTSLDLSVLSSTFHRLEYTYDP